MLYLLRYEDTLSWYDLSISFQRLFFISKYSLTYLDSEQKLHYIGRIFKYQIFLQEKRDKDNMPNSWRRSISSSTTF